MNIPKQVVDETGKRYGKLTVIRYAGIGRARTAMWLCKCDCGKTHCVSGQGLRRGHNTSCGCSRYHGFEKFNKARTLPLGEASRRHLLHRYKDGAKARGYTFELTREEFDKLTDADCYYCGAPPLGQTNVPLLNGGYKYNGIDRVDTTQGYTTDNCVPCCKRCNILKRDVTPQIIERAYTFLLREIP